MKPQTRSNSQTDFGPKLWITIGSSHPSWELSLTWLWLWNFCPILTICPWVSNNDNSLGYHLNINFQYVGIGSQNLMYTCTCPVPLPKRIVWTENQGSCCFVVCLPQTLFCYLLTEVFHSSYTYNFIIINILYWQSPNFGNTFIFDFWFSWKTLHITVLS